jgi:urease gamma subunit
VRIPLILFCLASASVEAQQRSLTVSVPEAGAAARTRVMRALVDEGVPIANVSACECQISSRAVDVRAGMTSMVTWATIDAAIFPDAQGSSVVLTALMSGSGSTREAVFAVRSDTTERMPGEEKASARLLHRIAARLSTGSSATRP